MIVFLTLPRFYVRPHECGKPLVAIREGRVLDRNEIAERAGVVLGLPVRQARAIVQDACFLPWKEEDYCKLQGQWLDVCARYTGIVEPNDQHNAWLDFRSHPRPVELLAQLRQELAATTGLVPSLGVAKAKWLAKVAAEVGDDDHLALNYPHTFLAELPVALLEPVAPEHRKRLHFLGYRQARDVADVPLETLRGQFGDEALIIQQASRGEGSAQVLANYPPDSLQDQFRFEGAADSLLVIEEAVCALARRIGERLIDRERQGSTLAVVIELEEGAILVRERTFTKPVRCPRSALAALRLLLNEPPQEPVAAIRVVLRDLRRTARSQLDLAGMAPAGEKDGRIASAFRYVRSVFGESAVVQASEVVPPRRQRVLKEWKDATGWR